MYNKGVFYSLRFFALFYLIILLTLIFMGLGQGSFLLMLLALLVMSGFIYLFYRASEEAKKGTHLGRILTGVCAALFFISFLMGNGQGMKWLGLVLACFWCYKIVYWEYD